MSHEIDDAGLTGKSKAIELNFFGKYQMPSPEATQALIGNLDAGENPFTVLGVTPDDTGQQIKFRFREVVRTVHPDTLGSDVGDYGDGLLKELPKHTKE